MSMRARVVGCSSDEQTHEFGAVLGVSMTNEKCTGEYLAAIVKLIERRFKADESILLVSDTLQRHNIAYQTGRDVDDCYDEAKQMGDDWLEANRETLREALDAGITIIRWDDALTMMDVAGANEFVGELVDMDAEFSAHMADSLQMFLGRRDESSLYGSPEHLAVCERFVREELGVIGALASQFGYLLYPGQLPPVAELTLQRLFVGNSPMKSRQIKMVRNKSRPEKKKTEQMRRKATV
jgi:tRNA-dependent cyclodipeptide synthase